MHTKAPSTRASLTDRLGERIRTGTALGRRMSTALDTLRGRRVPLHWTNIFAVVSAASLVVLFVTGIPLMLFYVPSGELTSYDGGYAPLVGAEVSQAFDSVMRISFDIPGGLLLRQAHHWAGLLLPASLMVQLAVSFFTGAFRRPRQWAWVLLFLLFVATLAGGWSGYALPDDLLSGSGLRIVQGIVLAIPVVGTWISWLLFGGQFPGQIIETLYPLHVAIVPVALVAIVIAGAWLSVKHGSPRFADSRSALLPTAAVKATGLGAMVVGILVLISATVTISPIWLQGPSSTGDAAAGSQPDWYTGFLDGALRLVPTGWEFEWLGGTITLAVLVPLAVIGAYLLLIGAAPFIAGWYGFVRDRFWMVRFARPVSPRPRPDTNLLDRPRNVPTRTGVGVAAIVFYAVLWGAASADIAATELNLSIEGVILFLQLTLIAGPPVAFVITRRICLDLQSKDRDLVLHGFETGRIVRLPGGDYAEVHEPVEQRPELPGETELPASDQAEPELTK